MLNVFMIWGIVKLNKERKKNLYVEEGGECKEVIGVEQR